MKEPKRKIWIDYETRSKINLKLCGMYRYFLDAESESDIVCMAWAIDDGPVKLWTPKHKTIPFRLEKTDAVYAFNIQFDRLSWQSVGKRYLFPYLPLNQCVDIMALCGRYTYPQHLDFAGKVLDLSLPKDAAGKRLIRKICVPPFRYTQADLDAFYSYCIRDVDSMRELVSKLPSDYLSATEQEAWIITAEMNERGLPVDGPLVKRILQAVDLQKKINLRQVPKITGGAIKSITQTQAITAWVRKQGVDLPNLRAETVDALLGEPHGLPSRVRMLLEMRKKFGKTSVAKLDAIANQMMNNRVYHNLRYYGAATGRWAGLGLQPHNFPRAHVEDEEAEIQKFIDGSIMKENPIESAKALVRACITAPKGKLLAIADFASIENVILAWVSGELSVLEIFERGEDEYTHFACDLWGLDYQAVSKDQRTFCKPVVLGAGYTLGARGLMGYAKGYGIDMTMDDAEKSIATYRRSRPEIVKFWYAVIDCAVLAIRNPGSKFTYNRCTFQVRKDRAGTRWLTLKLPSGRLLYYNDPEVRDYAYGSLPTAMGINSYTKQWERMKIIPGRMTENIVQALARDVLLGAKVKLRNRKYDLIVSVHDEIVAEVDDTFSQQDLEQMYKIMCAFPAWAPDLPLRAEGAIRRRYAKI